MERGPQAEALGFVRDGASWGRDGQGQGVVVDDGFICDWI